MRGRMTRRALAIVPVVLAAAVAPRLALADAVVGTGSAASCTEQALNAALGVGGTITFDCGPSAVTITLTSTKTITGAVTLDGADVITLSGGHAVRPFAVAVGGALALDHIVVSNGSSPDDGG